MSVDQNMPFGSERDAARFKETCIWRNANRQNDDVGLNFGAACQQNLHRSIRILKRSYAVAQAKPNAVLLHLLGQSIGHFNVERS
ncbi:hypothetical protein D3C77_449930 [compost metagenome]